MRPVGVFTQLLVSLVVCLESLNRQSSTTLTPQAVMALHMHEAPVIFDLLFRFVLVGPNTRSLVMLILPICVII